MFRINPFDDPKFVQGFLEKRRSSRSINNVLDTPVLLDLIGDLAGKTVVEVGCGAGDFSQRLVTTSLRLYRGIDSSASFVGVARMEASDPRFTFEVLNANKSFPDMGADVVVSGLSLHFVEDIHSLVAAIFRALAPSGLFVFSVRHPIRTCNPAGHSSDNLWIVRDYCCEGKRTFLWHGAECTLYHRTTATWISALVSTGFQVVSLMEPLVPRDRVLLEDVDHCSVPGALYLKCVKPPG